MRGGRIREASKDLTSGDFLIRGITTLASMNTIQIVLMFAYPPTATARSSARSASTGAPSIWVGIFSAGSAGWALAMTLENAALVRAAGQIELTRGRARQDCERSGEQIRMLTGYMPEHDCLPPDVTATEFVTHLGRMSGLPPTAAKERAAESLRHVGLYEERYRQIGTYSTGMKQRVKLAQALVGDPRLLLLDEPTIGLDPAGRASMLDLISRIGAEFGISIVVSSHLLGELEQICDHLVAIDGGKLLRADTMTSFTQASQVLLIEVEEGTGELLAELARRGLDPKAQDRAVLVRLAGEGTCDEVRGCRRRPRPAAEPDGAAAAPDRGTVPRRSGGTRRDDGSGRCPLTQPADQARRARGPPRHRRHPRPRLPPLRRPAAGPRGDRPGAVLAQPAVGLRHRPRRQGQDRAGHHLRHHVPARGVNAVAVASAARTPASSTTTPTLRPLRVIVMIIFIAALAPELVSRDLRSHVLPLYFSRPLRRLDYPLAKLAAFILACLAMIEIPLLLLYLGTVLQSHGFSAVWAQTRALIPGLLVGLMWAVLLAAIGLVLSSLSGRRAYSTGTIAIYFFLTWTLARLLSQYRGQGQPRHRARQRRPAAAARPGHLHPPGRDTGRSAPGRPGQPVHRAGRRTAVARRHSPGIIADPGGYGAAYGLMLLVFLGVRHRRPHRQVPESRHLMSAIELRNVSRWYGNVVAINDISMSIGPASPACSAPTAPGNPPCCT